MAIDSARARLTLIRLYNGAAHTCVWQPRQIVSAEIVEDGTSLHKTARMGQLGGAAIGGLVLGPVGAIIGGLSSGRRQIEKASRIELNILVDDLKLPLFRAVFLNVEVPKSGIAYRGSIEQARAWHGRIEALIHRSANNTQ